MPPDHQPPSSAVAGPSTPTKKDVPASQRLGNYHVGAEIGRGSFATVHKAYRSKTHEPVAIKAVSRQKLTAKLLENLESEINILKAINHRNIVGLEDCFKSDTHIYLVMEYCTGSDLSFYIKNRGRLPTLDFVPRPGMFFSGAIPPSSSQGGGKAYWPHPQAGGIDERVTRCFLGQLALKFLRSQNLIHRDIKPQNLLMQPPSAAELAEGHPLGVPVLKVADFGFARILPAAAMAETLCGSPLYMAPEILRYEKYDAKADLWSVGAVLFEMAVGKPPFRANNHVELLRRIEKGEDKIKFPDESSRQPSEAEAAKEPPPVPPGPDIKALIRRLLKRKPAERMGFEEFFASGVWDGFMSEYNPNSSSEEESLSPDLLSEGSSGLLGSRGRDLRRSREVEAERRLKDAVEKERSKVAVAQLEKPGPFAAPPAQAQGHRAQQPLAVDPALNPSTAPLRTAVSSAATPSTAGPSTSARNQPVSPVPAVSPVATPPVVRPVVRRSEPKYYVSDDPPIPSSSTAPAAQPPASVTPVAEPSSRISPRPIGYDRRLSNQTGSLDEPPPLTPSSNHPPPFARTRVSEGSPLASTPPITMTSEDTGKDGSALEGSDSVVGREYVMVEKQTVEVNALADEVDQASRANQALVRRPSTRAASVVTRPVSALRPSSAATSPANERPLAVPASYSPPFAMSTTPPFAIAPLTTPRPSALLGRPASAPQVPQQMTVFPPAAITGYSPESLVPRFGASPSSLQTGALARALTNTAIRMIGQGASSAATVLARAAAKRRPSIKRTGEMDDMEEDLLRSVEDVARKAFALFELGDARLGAWNALARRDGLGPGGSPFASSSPRRKSSSSSSNSDVLILRQQELAAGEACVLYCKALGFLVMGTNMIQRYWETGGGFGGAGVELNEMVQWLRARFNECYEKAEWAKVRCAEELPFIERLLHDKAREMSRHAAIAELQGDLATAEAGYENALWLLLALLDDAMYDGATIRDEDRASVEKVMLPIRTRLDALRRKIPEAQIAPQA